MALATQLPARLAAGDTTFTAGVGEVDITPDVKMTNHYTAHKPFGVVYDPLQVRALVIGDGATRGALLVWDLLDAGNSAVARAREEIFWLGSFFFFVPAGTRIRAHLGRLAMRRARAMHA